MDTEFLRELSFYGVSANLIDKFWKNTKENILNAPHFKQSNPLLIISDIHGNLPALNLCINYSNDHGIYDLLSLGDMVDYNEFNNETVERILRYKHHLIAIRGNHDSFFLDTKGNYRSMHESIIVKNHLAEEIKKLPHMVILEYENLQFLICHSNPWILDSLYLFPDRPEMMDYFLQGIPLNGFFYGHTHIPNIFINKKKLALNPGSLGQSRGPKQNLTFAWLDFETNIVQILGISAKRINMSNYDELEPKLIKKIEMNLNKQENFIYF